MSIVTSKIKKPTIKGVNYMHFGPPPLLPLSWCRHVLMNRIAYLHIDFSILF